MIIMKMKSIREQVYEALKEKIINGEISSGERIVEVDYAKEFGVSRTPLREALRMLEFEGLVNSSEKGGVVVNYISKQDIEEIYKIRITLEKIVFSEIISKHSDDIINLEILLEETEKILENGSYEEIILIFEKFNEEIYKISNLNHVIKLIKNINEYVKRVRILCLKDKNRLRQAFYEHCELVKALKEKKLEKILKINEKHLLASMNFVLEKMKDL